MSLYSRYSESSISVSYFSRSSALICSDVLLPANLPGLPVGPLSARVVAGWEPWSHLSSPISLPLGRRVRFALDHHPGVRPVRYAPDIDERMAVLGAGTQPGQRRAVRGRAVPLVFGEAVAGVVGVQ